MLLEILDKIYWVSCLLTLYFYAKSSQLSKRIIQLLIASTIVAIVSYFLAKNELKNDLIFNLNNYLELYLMYRIYQLLIHDVSKKIMIILLILVVIFGIYDSIFIEPIDTYQGIFSFFKSICVLGLCLISFYTVYKEEKVIYLEKDAIFWLNSGILIYYLSTLFIQLFTNYLIASFPEYVYDFTLYLQFSLAFVFLAMLYGALRIDYLKNQQA